MDFWVFGMNHKYSSLENLAQIQFHSSNQTAFVEQSMQQGLKTIIILSTCNRLEIYGQGDIEKAISLFYKVLNLTESNKPLFFIKNEMDAVQHFFKVACGLESKIIGDLEILGQFKKAIKESKRQRMLSGYVERMANSVAMTAKDIRSNTSISSGSSSISYVLTKYLNQEIAANNYKRILIIGTGVFGSQIMRNVRDYCKDVSLSLCNRTKSKATLLLKEVHADIYDYEDLAKIIHLHDIVISSIHCENDFLINLKEVSTINKKMLFVDMSVPYSINKDITQNPNISLEKIETIVETVQTDMQNRKKDIDIAQKIIDKNIQEFVSWTKIFEKSEAIQYWKQLMIEGSQTCPYLQSLSDAERARIVKISLSEFVIYLKNHIDLPNDKEFLIEHFTEQTKKNIPNLNPLSGNNHMNIQIKP